MAQIFLHFSDREMRPISCQIWKFSIRFVVFRELFTSIVKFTHQSTTNVKKVNFIQVFHRPKRQVRPQVFHRPKRRVRPRVFQRPKRQVRPHVLHRHNREPMLYNFYLHKLIWVLLVVLPVPPVFAHKIHVKVDIPLGHNVHVTADLLLDQEDQITADLLMTGISHTSWQKIREINLHVK